MKKRLFRRTVAACMTLALSLGGLTTAADATSLSRDSGTYAQAAFESEYTYGGSDLGAEWTAAGTTFRVWSPFATEMQVNLYRSGTAGTKDRIDPYPMTKDVNGTWVVTIPGDIHGTYYTYRNGKCSQRLVRFFEFGCKLCANGADGNTRNVVEKVKLRHLLVSHNFCDDKQRRH